MSLDLPLEAPAPMPAEAARRRMSVESPISEKAERFPDHTPHLTPVWLPRVLEDTVDQGRCRVWIGPAGGFDPALASNL